MEARNNSAKPQNGVIQIALSEKRIINNGKPLDRIEAERTSGDWQHSTPLEIGDCSTAAGKTVTR